MAEHRTGLALKFLLALGGLVGMVWLVWPKPPLRQTLEPSVAGSSWLVERDRAVLSGPTQGTTFAVVIPGAHEVDELSRVQASVDDELAGIDGEMSTWREDSDLSRFNAAPAGTTMAVGERLIAVLVIAREVSELSGGAFDVTVAPLVDAWGFGVQKSAVEPDPETLEQLRARVGYRSLVIDAAAGTLTKPNDLRVDVAAIAPGYAADRLGLVLERADIENYMIELGGEVRSRGSNPAGEPWKIGIEQPDVSGSRTVNAVVRVNDGAVATSGDYRNYWEKDGRRYSHTIDPRTGRPVDHALASVTVIVETAALADAWATALSVLGPEGGFELAEEQGIAAYFLVREGEQLAAKATSGFAAYE